MKLFKLLLLLIISISCNKMPQTEEEPARKDFTQILKSYNRQNINLDDFKEIPIQPDLIINDSSFSNTNMAKSFLAMPTGCIVKNDIIYIVDSQLNQIIAIDTAGHIHFRIGRTGSAPSEFKRPFSIRSNDKRFFVTDVGNNRIQIFDNSWNYLQSIFAAVPPFSKNILVTPSSLYVPDPIIHNMFDIYTTTDSVISSEPDTTIVFTPFTSDVNKHFLNYQKIYYVKKNVLLNCYISRPFIYLSDLSGKISAILEFSGEYIDNVMSNIYDENQNGYAILIHDIAIGDNEIFIGMGRYLLVINIQNNEFHLKKKYKINPNYSLTEFTYSNGSIYTCQWSKARILRFKIN